MVLGLFGGPLFSQSLNRSMNVSDEEVKIVTSDIDLFWECFDTAKPTFASTHFQKYLEEGSQGVKDFIPMRIQSAKKLAKTVKNKQAEYESIRAASLQVQEKYYEDIKARYVRLKELYPDAKFAPAYFVIGRFNSGGTATDNGIMMGVELFGQIGFDNMPAIVAHELIHFQQNLPQSENLLGQAILEGSADFLGKLISRDSTPHYLDEWAVPREAEIWHKFQKDMSKNSYSGWMYGGKYPEGWPTDIGYWMGYRIVKAFYDKQEDKKEAIYQILNIQDFDQFLATSGYEGR